MHQHDHAPTDQLGEVKVLSTSNSSLQVLGQEKTHAMSSIHCCVYTFSSCQASGFHHARRLAKLPNARASPPIRQTKTPQNGINGASIKPELVCPD